MNFVNQLQTAAGREKFHSTPQAIKVAGGRVALILPGHKIPIVLTGEHAGLLRSRIHAVLTARRLARK